jgi:hypothetical protein
MTSGYKGLSRFVNSPGRDLEEDTQRAPLVPDQAWLIMEQKIAVHLPSDLLRDLHSQ